MNAPLVTVIIPVYKVEKYLRNCVNSVLSQSYTNWEAILVDDGSPDSCGDICDEYAKKDDRIQVIHKKNAGVAAARNSALEKAIGDYSTFLDSDDFLHPDYLSTLIKLIRKYDANIAQCDFIQGKDIVFPAAETKQIENAYTSQEVFIKDVANVIVWGKLYKTELLKMIHIPEGRFFEDDLVTWRWYYAARKIVVTSRQLYYYTCNDESTMAKHKKKPNLCFIDAYDERSDFFTKVDEREMRDCTDRQCCKALLLTYGNPYLTKEQKILVLKRFKRSWDNLKHSSVLSCQLKILFMLFNVMPTLTSWIINKLRR